jgi:hypothetical protein
MDTRQRFVVKSLTHYISFFNYLDLSLHSSCVTSERFL